MSARAGYQKIKAVLMDLSEAPAAEREALARDCLADDPEMLQRVLAMLQCADPDDEFLESGLPQLMGLTVAGLIHPEERLPRATQVGNYLIEEELGAGGMGVVYRARQIRPVQRTVALKLIGRSATALQVRRFETECRLQARFNHPNVSTIYELGEWRPGQPFAAMELITGEPITEWCESRCASLNRRLELFIGACRGVAHAHEKGILHRDLKPSNILVEMIDGRPTAKVIDFGIASVLEAMDGVPEVADSPEGLGTPAYMSPEALLAVDTGSKHQMVDARSDVYALGIVLCELLTGQRPHAVEGLSQAERVAVKTDTPAPPLDSLLKRHSPDQRERVAQCFGVRFAALLKALRGDLDAIVRRALAVDPADRYGTVTELAADLKAHLQGQPVAARAPTFRYVGGKFLRRHWVPAGAAALLMLALTGGLVMRSVQINQTRAALGEASAVSEFLVHMIQHASPNRLEGDEILLEDVMDQAARDMEARLLGYPEAQARLLKTLGQVYGERGDYNRAVDLLSESLALYEQEGISEAATLAPLLADLGDALRKLRRLEDAEPILLRAQMLAEEGIETAPLLVANVANSLGNLYLAQTQYGEAERYHRQALMLREAHLPASDLQIGGALNNIGSDLIWQWRMAEAEPFTRRALENFIFNLPEGHPWIGVARNNLAIILERQGRFDESLALFEEAREEIVRRLGAGHPDVSDYHRNISLTWMRLGEYEASLAEAEQAYRILNDAIGPEAPRTLAAKRRFGDRHVLYGDYEKAISITREVYETSRAVLGADNRHTLTAARIYARALFSAGGYQDVMALLAELLPHFDSVFGQAHDETLLAKRVDAWALAYLGSPQEALVQLRELLAAHVEQESQPTWARTLLYFAAADVALLAEATEDAVAWAQAALELGLARHETVYVARAYQLLGQAYRQQGQFAAARQATEEALTRLRQLMPPDHPWLRQASEDMRNLAIVKG